MCNVRQTLRNSQIPVTKPLYLSGKSLWFSGVYPKSAGHLSFSSKLAGWQFRNPKTENVTEGPTLLWQALWFSCMWLHSSGQIGTIIPLNLNLKGIFFWWGGGFPYEIPPIWGDQLAGWSPGATSSTNKTGAAGSKKFLMFLCLSLSHSIHVIMPYVPTWKP